MARNKIEDLRNHLFETIEMIKEGDMELEKAKVIAELAQVLVNSAKIEIDYIKAVDGTRGTGFIHLENEIKKIEQ